MQIDHAELRRRLQPILEAEERQDWAEVEQLSYDLKFATIEPDNVPEIVNHYLDDGDIRQKDERYGDNQRSQIRRFIETGEYPATKSIPLWSCGLLAALIIAGLIWLLT